MIVVGSLVRVKPSVFSPHYGWGSVTSDSVGVVTRLDDNGEMTIDFPEHSGWMGYLDEMELATNDTGITLFNVLTLFIYIL